MLPRMGKLLAFQIPFPRLAELQRQILTEEKSVETLIVEQERVRDRILMERPSKYVPREPLGSCHSISYGPTIVDRVHSHEIRTLAVEGKL